MKQEHEIVLYQIDNTNICVNVILICKFLNVENPPKILVLNDSNNYSNIKIVFNSKH